MNLRNRLDQLIEIGAIVAYKYEENVPTENSLEMRLVEKLTLVFPTGDVLKLATHCSGCLENTILYVEE